MSQQSSMKHTRSSCSSPTLLPTLFIVSIAHHPYVCTADKYLRRNIFSQDVCGGLISDGTLFPAVLNVPHDLSGVVLELDHDTSRQHYDTKCKFEVHAPRHYYVVPIADFFSSRKDDESGRCLDYIQFLYSGLGGISLDVQTLCGSWSWNYSGTIHVRPGELDLTSYSNHLKKFWRSKAVLQVIFRIGPKLEGIFSEETSIAFRIVLIVYKACVGTSPKNVPWRSCSGSDYLNCIANNVRCPSNNATCGSKEGGGCTQAPIDSNPVQAHKIASKSSAVLFPLLLSGGIAIVIAIGSIALIRWHRKCCWDPNPRIRAQLRALRANRRARHNRQTQIVQPQPQTQIVVPFRDVTRPILNEERLPIPSCPAHEEMMLPIPSCPAYEEEEPPPSYDQACQPPPPYHSLYPGVIAQTSI